MLFKIPKKSYVFKTIDISESSSTEKQAARFINLNLFCPIVLVVVKYNVLLGLPDILMRHMHGSFPVKPINKYCPRSR